MNENQHYALLAVPVLAFLEAMVGIGLFISGAILLTVSTVLYSQEIATLWQILPLAFVFAALSDHVGYYLGRYLGPRFHHSKFAERYATKVAKTEQFILDYGSAAVILGRLLTAVRSLVPMFIGISGMNRLTFTIFDLIACFIWASGLGLLVVGLDNLFN
ncbi:MAG: DedA family protein [Gammaproteobacteria bacterium]|jgi:membrane-associated protein